METARRALEQQRREIAAEKEQMLNRQHQLDEQESRLRHNTGIVENQQNNITREQRGRCQSRLSLRGETLNPTALFTTPIDQSNRVAPEVPSGRIGTGPLPGNVTGGVRDNTGVVPPPPRFHTPPGHYNNPTDNVYAATLALDRIPLGDSPREVETRRAIDMLRTAVIQ